MALTCCTARPTQIQTGKDLFLEEIRDKRANTNNFKQRSHETHETHLRQIAAHQQQELQDHREWEWRKAMAMDVLVLLPLLLTAVAARHLGYPSVGSAFETVAAAALFASIASRRWRLRKMAKNNLVAQGLPDQPQDSFDKEVSDLVARFECSPLLDAGLTVDSGTCRRFLIAWKEDVEGATRGLKKYVEWRRRVRPAELRPTDFRHEMATRKGFAHGLDQYGHPIVWAFAGKHDKNKRDIKETEKLILYCLEEALRISQRCSGAEKVCLVFDLSDFGLKSMDYEVVKRLIIVLANYYPERLGQVLLWNAPIVFSGFWQIISPFIDPVTFRKIRFVDDAALMANIDRSVMPVEVLATLGLGHRSTLRRASPRTQC
mmetsp:Transcript_84247/g.176302  ORF Transcript_84247/g.176302 Transcript_84247/m.176302 type:complete len:375 (+) Transcript_84247:80-1204(+)